MERQMIRLLAALLCVVATAGAAQDQRRPSHCIAIADAAPGIAYLQQASWTAPIAEYSVRIHYIAHASFMIQTRGGLEAVTDYNGFIGNTRLIPDIVTMNHAHSTHWTNAVDPAIPHVLRGWGAEFGTGIDHHLDLGEMLIRNVSTDIRSSYGGDEPRGNSIFIFEVEGLCIAHLGHLHHEPTNQQYAALGRADVLMVPVDGGYTLPLAAVERIVDRLKSSIVIPMHWFSGYALERFLEDVGDTFVIDRRDTATLEISLRDLPRRPTVMVLQPRFLADPE
jgi:L-ascorbate metabolism protein UlaG (beta-lactamase superfamily)